MRGHNEIILAALLQMNKKFKFMGKGKEENLVKQLIFSIQFNFIILPLESKKFFVLIYA